MTYKVAIRKNSTGEIRQYEIEWDWFKDDSDDFYWWTQGNYQCDCNRELSFIRASGREVTDEEFDAVQCTDGAYSALYAELPDGRRIELDDCAVETNRSSVNSSL